MSLKAKERQQLQLWDVWHYLWSQRVKRGGWAGRAPTDCGVPSSLRQWSPRLVQWLMAWKATLAFQDWAGACPVSGEWVAKLGLAQGFAGFWGNSGWASLLTAFLPPTPQVPGVCGALSRWCSGIPVLNGAQSPQEPIHTDPSQGCTSNQETIVIPRGNH